MPSRSTPGKPWSVQADDPLLVNTISCVIWAEVPVAAPRAKLRSVGWHVALPAACPCCDDDEGELAGWAAACVAEPAVAAGLAGRVVAGVLELVEQPATMNPAAT